MHKANANYFPRNHFDIIVAYETDKFSPPKANINLPHSIKIKALEEEKFPFFYFLIYTRENSRKHTNKLSNSEKT